MTVDGLTCEYAINPLGIDAAHPRFSWVFDIGQFVSGWTELRVNGPRGSKVTLRHAGRVNYENQALDARNSRGAPQTDSYILKGDGPEVVGDLTSARASVKTVRGPVAVDWQRSDGSFALRASVPVNTSAGVHVPSLGLRDVAIRESGKTVWAAGAYVHGADGISNGRETDDGVVFDAGSGSYVFEMTGRS